MLQTQNNTPASSSRPSPADLTGQLIDAARKAGADAAEAVFGESRSLSIGVRKGAVETIESDETSDLGLRVFVGQKQAVVSVSEFSPRTLERLVERCVAMARIAPDDAYTGLADKALLYSGHTDGLDIFDPTELNAETLKDRALSAEAAGVALDQALQSDSASAGRVQSRWY
ncbi:MAG: DNA gyrase modulator, partial [Asticcacaulis sp.]